MKESDVLHSYAEEELKVGQKVKIVDGPFSSMFGIIEEVDMSSQSLTLNVDLFGQETSVEVELNQIELVK